MSFIKLHGFLHMESKCHWKNGIGIRLQPKVFIPNHPELGRIVLNQAVILILGSIARESKIIGEEDTVKSILDGEDGLHKYEYLVSQNMKSKIQP